MPLLLLLNNRPATNTDPTRREKSGFWPAEQVIARGYGIAALQVGELAPDDKDRFRDGVIRLFEGTVEGTRPGERVGRAGGVGWGASRAMDYFVTSPRIDADGSRSSATRAAGRPRSGPAPRTSASPWSSRTNR